VGQLAPRLLIASVAGGELSGQEVSILTPGWAQEEVGVWGHHQRECFCESGGFSAACDTAPPHPVGVGLGILSSMQSRGSPMPCQQEERSPFRARLTSLCTPLCIPPFSPKQAHKNQVVAGKKEAVKVAPHKAQRAHPALGVAKNNEINLKKWVAGGDGNRTGAGGTLQGQHLQTCPIGKNTQ